jgi:hypothetical protein
VSYLIDTSVIYELARTQPDPRVVEWFKTIPDSALYLSVLSLGELRKRVEKLPDAARREKLRLWLKNDLPAWFGDHLLPVDAGVADRWGRLQAEAVHPLSVVNGLLAATALQHDLRLVMCNGKDLGVQGLGVVEL